MIIVTKKSHTSVGTEFRTPLMPFDVAISVTLSIEQRFVDGWIDYLLHRKLSLVGQIMSILEHQLLLSLLTVFCVIGKMANLFQLKNVTCKGNESY